MVHRAAARKATNEELERARAANTALHDGARGELVHARCAFREAGAARCGARGVARRALRSLCLLAPDRRRRERHGQVENDCVGARRFARGVVGGRTHDDERDRTSKVPEVRGVVQRAAWSRHEGFQTGKGEHGDTGWLDCRRCFRRRRGQLHFALPLAFRRRRLALRSTVVEPILGRSAGGWG